MTSNKSIDGLSTHAAKVSAAKTSVIKTNTKKSTKKIYANSIPNGETLGAFPLRTGTKQDVSSQHSFSTLYWKL